MATKHHSKKHHSKKSHSKKSHTKKVNSSSMSNDNAVAKITKHYCPQCKKPAALHDGKVIHKKMKNGRTMRYLAALCPMNHKVSRILGFD